MSIAFLFPGRGSQRPGMLHRLPDTAASATVLAEADVALRALAPTAGREGGGNGGNGDGPGREYADGIVELDSAEALQRSPVACHLALLIAGVAGARALIEDEEVRPAYVAGHGTGGYAAAVLAGVLTFEEALRAVRLRGELLHAAESGDGGPEGDVAIRLAQHLATVKRRPQSVTYVGGLQGRPLRGETNAVFDDLAWSVARPVLWTEVTSRLAEAGVLCGVEMPPGRALTEELTARSPQVPGAPGAPSPETPGVRAVSVEEHGIAEAAEIVRAVSGRDDRRERPCEEDEFGPGGRLPVFGEHARTAGTSPAGAGPDDPADGVPGEDGSAPRGSDERDSTPGQSGLA